MAMKLSRMLRHCTRRRFTIGSKRVVKKHEVATQATPMDTFDACMLAKNATQCRASRIPHPPIFIIARRGVWWSRPIQPSTAVSTTTLVIILYHTNGSPPNEMSLPKMPVHPARNTATCRIIRVNVFSLMFFFFFTGRKDRRYLSYFFILFTRKIGSVDICGII